MYEGKILVRHVYCTHIDGLTYMYKHSLCYKGIDSCMIVVTCKPSDGISYISSHPVHSSINASIYCESNTATIKTGIQDKHEQREASRGDEREALADEMRLGGKQDRGKQMKQMQRVKIIDNVRAILRAKFSQVKISEGTKQKSQAR